MKHGYAQTILQLLEQLNALGYPQSDLERVRRGADFANKLFGAMLRGSGKPFSAHLIGTASILARYGGSVSMVSAGLLHAAYAQADWSDGAAGATPTRRQTVREVLGDEAEDLIHGYSEFRWRQPGAVAEHARSYRSGDVANRRVLLMRLANELEEYLDFGILYTPDAEKRKQFPRIYGPYMIELARTAGVPELSAELAAAFAAIEAMQVPPSLRATRPDRIGGVTDARDFQPSRFHSPLLLDYVERHATERPEAVAINNGDEDISWAALLPRVAGLANAIAAVADPRRPVAARLRQSNMPIAMLAALRAGRTLAPISTDYPPARRSWILEALEAGCLLVDSDTAELEFNCSCPIVNVDSAGTLEPDRAPRSRSDTSAPALVIFTSGSTGEPIGVLHSEDNLVQVARRSVRALQIGPSDRLSMLSRGVHISGITDMVRSFVSGATLVTCDVAALGVDAASDVVRKAGVTVLHCTPSLAATLFGTVNDRDPFRTVRIVHLGGETLPASVVALCHKSLPAGAVVVNQLGCTESSGFCQAFLRADTVIPQDVVPAGFPVDGVRVRILDEHDRPVGEGETGRIEVAGDGLTLGYWKASERTSTGFRPPEAGQPRRVLTGDLGRWLPDGQLEHRGRIDQQVQVRGYRVELAEIENALRRLDMIADAAVVAPANGTEVRIVAHIVPTKHAIDLKALHTLLGRTLPSSMLPRKYEVHESLPRTATGKVDRPALVAIAPTSIAELQECEDISPHGLLSDTNDRETLRIVTSVWGELLGVEKMGDDDDFFILGGDSLLAMRACSRLTLRMQVEVNIRDILEATTPRQFAQRLATARQGMPDSVAVSAGKDLRSLIAEIEAMPIDEVRRQLDE